MPSWSSTTNLLVLHSSDCAEQLEQFTPSVLFLIKMIWALNQITCSRIRYTQSFVWLLDTSGCAPTLSMVCVYTNDLTWVIPVEKKEDSRVDRLQCFQNIQISTVSLIISSLTNYTMSQKSVPPLACYNFDTYEWILIFFGRHVIDKVGNQKTLYYATSSNLCFCTTWQNREMQNLHFHSVGLCYTHNAPVCCLPERNSCHLWCVW